MSYSGMMIFAFLSFSTLEWRRWLVAVTTKSPLLFLLQSDISMKRRWKGKRERERYGEWELMMITFCFGAIYYPEWDERNRQRGAFDSSGQRPEYWTQRVLSLLFCHVMNVWTSFMFGSWCDSSVARRRNRVAGDRHKNREEGMKQMSMKPCCYWVRKMIRLMMIKAIILSGQEWRTLNMIQCSE